MRNFSTYLRSRTPQSLNQLQVDLPIRCDKPTKEEIRKAITLMKNGKAAGPDDIPVEALKVDLKTSAAMLYPLFERIWVGRRHTN